MGNVSGVSGAGTPQYSSSSSETTSLNATQAQQLEEALSFFNHFTTQVASLKAGENLPKK